jgi:hypothetical protein
VTVTIVVFMAAVLLARLVRGALGEWLDPSALLAPQPAIAHEHREPPSRSA